VARARAKALGVPGLPAGNERFGRRDDQIPGRGAREDGREQVGEHGLGVWPQDDRATECRRSPRGNAPLERMDWILDVTGR